MRPARGIRSLSGRRAPCNSTTRWRSFGFRADSDSALAVMASNFCRAAFLLSTSARSTRMSAPPPEIISVLMHGSAVFSAVIVEPCLHDMDKPFSMPVQARRAAAGLRRAVWLRARHRMDSDASKRGGAFDAPIRPGGEAEELSGDSGVGPAALCRDRMGPSSIGRIVAMHVTILFCG